MITRQMILDYAAERYGVMPDFPWAKYPACAVLRHRSAHRRWFALLMNLPAAKLGLPGCSNTEIINLKCEPVLISGLRQSSGVYPAYHMNKEHWFSLDLNSDFAAEEVLRLLDLSFDLTR